MRVIDFKYCPACKAGLVAAPDAVRCVACGFQHWENPAPGAGIIPIQDGKALVAIRAVDPFKGQSDIIGGFMQRDETPEQTALRELSEETGLEATITQLLGVYPDTYGADGKPTLNFIHIGQITGGKMAAHDDVAELRWIPIAELPLDQGFTHIRQAFRDLQSQSVATERQA